MEMFNEIGFSPSGTASWERRFSYPTQRSPGSWSLMEDLPSEPTLHAPCLKRFPLNGYTQRLGVTIMMEWSSFGLPRRVNNEESTVVRIWSTGSEAFRRSTKLSAQKAIIVFLHLKLVNRRLRTFIAFWTHLLRELVLLLLQANGKGVSGL